MIVLLDDPVISKTPLSENKNYNTTTGRNTKSYARILCALSSSDF